LDFAATSVTRSHGAARAVPPRGAAQRGPRTTPRGIELRAPFTDRVVVEDSNAPPIWARFYELRTNVPIFSSRCEVAECEDDPFFMRRYSLAEIENERRVGYS
jgi:PelA/Pel-15E family pectate lyase